MTEQPNSGGERAGGAPEAAAHVEDAQARAQARQPCEPLRRGLAAAVELIGGGQVVDGQCGEILAGGGERVDDRAVESRAPPVVVGRASVVHCGPSDQLPCARAPPSTTTCVPVMKEASSEARKRAQRAMSSGSPTRPMGMP